MSKMYPNQRRARARVLDDSVMRDLMTEMCDLHVSVFCASTSWLCVSHVVYITVIDLFSTFIVLSSNLLIMFISYLWIKKT
jgi:hypothetical protein